MHMGFRVQMAFQAEITAEHGGTFAKTLTELRNNLITGIPLGTPKPPRATLAPQAYISFSGAPKIPWASPKFFFMAQRTGGSSTAAARCTVRAAAVQASGAGRIYSCRAGILGMTKKHPISLPSEVMADLKDGETGGRGPRGHGHRERGHSAPT